MVSVPGVSALPHPWEVPSDWRGENAGEPHGCNSEMLGTAQGASKSCLALSLLQSSLAHLLANVSSSSAVRYYGDSPSPRWRSKPQDRGCVQRTRPLYRADKSRGPPRLWLSESPLSLQFECVEPFNLQRIQNGEGDPTRLRHHGRQNPDQPWRAGFDTCLHRRREDAGEETLAQD